MAIEWNKSNGELVELFSFVVEGANKNIFGPGLEGR